ncbi:SRPBCC family protein [Methylobrevis pamukkalensis]|uniref:Carbon monoxide dehydrogenase subunit G (CoxG) n=1 Tax=Methylobrevis pamukkalensis TaxID=1439726 RepID=A0A1E3H846_9HYPH|nr:SRPBCC family protein [Methylobrevis pamukkalensis]ODN72315.1 Carbon monoxide dehydrogenase subunit G (CoxG) [Methylobrevis pamukkalensis]
MKLQQDFTINRPVDEVWAFFHDIPALAECLPGAEYLGPKEGGGHTGKVTSKVGPFQASFEGEAQVVYDETARTIALDGKGVDRKGNSRGKMTMTCTVVPDGATTKVGVESDIQLSGTIAQFGRTGIIAEIANILVADFVRNVETRLQAAAPVAATADGSVATPAAPVAAPPAETKPLGGFRLLLLALKGWIRNLVKPQSSSR